MSSAHRVRLWLIASFLLPGLIAIGCAPAAKQPPAAAKAAAKDDHDHDHDHAETKKKPEAKQEADEHADHKHPETLAEGVAELEKLVGTVKEHLKADAKDAKEKADDAVHAIGHLLEDFEKLVPAAKLSAEAEAAAKKAVTELYDCFDKLDVALHAEAGKGDSPADVHAQVAEKIEAAIKQLKGTKPAQPAAETPEKK